LEQPSSPIYRRKGEEVAAQLAQASRWLPLEISRCNPELISSPPLVSNLLEKLRKYYESLSDLIFFFFVLPLTNLKWKRFTQGYGNFTEALKKPRWPVFKKRREVLAAQLAQVCWLLSQEGRKNPENSRWAQI